jgi:hypothetical protein
MKTTVSIQDISELEIKPEAAVGRWRELVRQDVERRWKGGQDCSPVTWPVGGPGDSVPAFERDGFAYVENRVCGSLYAQVRPTERDLWEWYRTGSPAVFWREQILPASSAARLEQIMRPRADWILAGLAEYHAGARRVIDLSPYSEPLLELIHGESPQLEITAAGVVADLQPGGSASIRRRPTMLDDLGALGTTDAIVAIDTFNRASNPVKFLGALAGALRPGGLVFATMAVASGFEIQALWDRSPTIIPPDKLNLPTIDALQRIFRAPDWEIVELSTPGMFDVEVVRRALQREPAGPWPRVVRSLVDNADQAGRLALIELLQGRRLTSFARLVVRKLS